MSKRILAFSAAALLGLIATNAAQAASIDDRWLPFQGCWRAADAPATSLVCIVAEGNGVRMVELTDGTIARESQLTADGTPRPVSQEGCTGNEKARWSADGRRLYIDTELTCGDQFKRTTTGVFSMISPTEWVSIQAIAVDKEAATRTVRYTAVENVPTASAPESIIALLRQNRLARETARYASAAPLTLEQVTEASREVHPRAVEALLIARKQQFNLNGKQLVALADAGMPRYLIDALVAVSHPEMFVVKDRPAEGPGGRDRNAYSGRYCDSWDDWYDPWCGSYGYRRYSPWGYYGYGNSGGYGFNNGYYGYGFQGVPVIVVRGSDEDTGGRTRGTASPRGYTNGRSTTGSSVSAGSSSSSGSSSGGSSSTSSGSSSSGGGSSSTAGKAKPRGGGL